MPLYSTPTNPAIEEWEADQAAALERESGPPPMPDLGTAPPQPEPQFAEPQGQALPPVIEPQYEFPAGPDTPAIAARRQPIVDPLEQQRFAESRNPQADVAIPEGGWGTPPPVANEAEAALLAQLTAPVEDQQAPGTLRQRAIDTGAYDSSTPLGQAVGGLLGAAGDVASAAWRYGGPEIKGDLGLGSNPGFGQQVYNAATTDLNPIDQQMKWALGGGLGGIGYALDQIPDSVTGDTFTAPNGQQLGGQGYEGGLRSVGESLVPNKAWEVAATLLPAAGRAKAGWEAGEPLLRTIGASALEAVAMGPGVARDARAGLGRAAADPETGLLRLLTGDAGEYRPLDPLGRGAVDDPFAGLVDTPKSLPLDANGRPIYPDANPAPRTPSSARLLPAKPREASPSGADLHLSPEPSPSAAAGPPPQPSATADLNADEAAMNYSLKKLADAKAQGMEAFKAEQARQTAILSARQAEKQAGQAVSARAKFSNTGKANAAETRTQMEIATAKRMADSAVAQAKAMDEASEQLTKGTLSAGVPPANSMSLEEALQGIVDDPIAVIQRSQGLAEGVTPETTRFLEAWSNGNRTLDTIQAPSGFGRHLNTVKAAVSGEYVDSYLTGLTHRLWTLEEGLKRGGMVDDEVRAIVQAATAKELGLHYGNNQKLIGKALNTMLENEVRGVEINRVMSGVNELTQEAKNTIFGLMDIGVGGQQGLTALRYGNVQMIAALTNRLLSVLHVPGARKLWLDAALPRSLQFIADGGQLGFHSSGLNPSTGTILAELRRVPGVGKTLAKIDRPLVAFMDKATKFQFETVMGSLKQLVYEGDLVLKDLAGLDITKPAVRRVSADSANAIGSSARNAITPGRRELEYLTQTSSQMTRAQVNRLLQATKLLRPDASMEERVSAALMIASQSLYIGAIGKFVNDQIGITDWVMSPFDKGYGTITLPTTDSNGDHHTINIIPQASMETALRRSVMAIKDMNETDLRDAWLKYASSRAGMWSRVGLGFMGTGYDANGKFYPGIFGGKDLPNKDAVMGTLPIPPVAQNAMQGITDPTTIGLQTGGLNVYPESEYGAKARENPQFTKAADVYFTAYDTAYEEARNGRGEAAAVLKPYKTLDDYRQHLREIYARDKVPSSQWQSLITAKEKEIGLTYLIHEAQKRAVDMDPALIQYLEDLANKKLLNGEDASGPPKWLREYSESQKALPAGVR